MEFRSRVLDSRCSAGRSIKRKHGAAADCLTAAVIVELMYEVKAVALMRPAGVSADISPES